MAIETTTTTDPEAPLVAPRDFSGRSAVGGLFADHAQARQAIDDLMDAGFSEDQIGVALRDLGEQGELIDDTGVHTHAGSGAASGAVVGGALGLLFGLGALAIPGVGPVVAGGLLASAFGVGAAGAVTGGIWGALIGLSIPEHEAHHFAHSFTLGQALVTVNAGPRAAEAVAILERNGADTGANLRADSDPTP